MKKALRSILALLTALILACTGGPFRPVTSEAADSKAPYLRVTGITDQSLTVELVAGDSYSFKAFGGAIEYNADILQMASFSSSLPNASYDGGDSAGYSYYVDVYCSSGNWNVSAGTVLCRWVFKSRTKSGKLACLATYPFEYETEWTDNLKSWNTGTVLKTSQYFEHWYDGGKVTKAATCTQTGVKTFTCTHCGVTRTEAIPALGHAWDEGVESIEVGEFSGGVKMYTCTRCGATYDESIPATADLVLSGLRNLVPRSPNAKELTFVRQPEGGLISRTSREGFELKVEVEGGTPPYTYEWYSYDPDWEPAPASPASELDKAYEEFCEKYKNVSKAIRERLWKYYKDRFISVSEEPVKEESTETRSSATKLLKNSEENSIQICDAEYQYYCIVRDASGKWRRSDIVEMGWKLWLSEQPEDQYPYEDYIFSVTAEDGQAPYSYGWYYYDEDVPYSDWKMIPGASGRELPADTEGLLIDEPIICIVGDATGELVFSNVVYVRHDPVFTIVKMELEKEEIAVGETTAVSIWVQDGEAPITLSLTGNGLNYRTSAFTEERLSDGTQVRKFEIALEEPGAYLVTATDKNNAYTHDLVTVGRKYVDDGSDSEGSLIADWPAYLEMWDGGTQLVDASILLKGGEAPYTIEWYHSPSVDGRHPGKEDYEIIRRDKLYSDGWYEDQVWHDAPYGDTTGDYYDTSFCTVPANYVAIKVIDSDGREAWKDGIEVIYKGDKPFILEQPSDLTIPYDDLGRISHGLYCFAIGYNNQTDDLEYSWRLPNPNPNRGETVPASGDADRPGYLITSYDQSIHGEYVCRVIDGRTGGVAWSRSASVSVPLEKKDAFVHYKSEDLTVATVCAQGGKAPYTVEVYRMISVKGENTDKYFDGEELLYTLTYQEERQIHGMLIRFPTYTWRKWEENHGYNRWEWVDQKQCTNLRVYVTDANGDRIVFYLNSVQITKPNSDGSH